MENQTEDNFLGLGQVETLDEDDHAFIWESILPGRFGDKAQRYFRESAKDLYHFCILKHMIKSFIELPTTSSYLTFYTIKFFKTNL